MGQNEVKIPTADHMLLFRLNKYDHLQIEVYTKNYGDEQLQYRQSYAYHQLSNEMKMEFHSIKDLYNTIEGSIDVCCASNKHGHYRIQFKNGEVIMQRRSGGRELVMRLRKIGEEDSGDDMNQVIGDKMGSTEDRMMERQKQDREIVQYGDHQQQQRQQYQQPNRTTVNLQPLIPPQHTLYSTTPHAPLTLVQSRQFFRLKSGVHITLCKKLIKPTLIVNYSNNSRQSRQIIIAIKSSVLNPLVVMSLDLMGNRITTNGLRQLLRLKWKCLKKLWLDDNFIDDIQGVDELANLSLFTISDNLLSQQAARHISYSKYEKLQFLKISFISQLSIQPQQCLQIMLQKNGENFPALKKLVVFNYKKLSQKLTKKLIRWKEEDNFLDRKFVVQIKPQLMKAMKWKLSVREVDCVSDKDIY